MNDYKNIIEILKKEKTHRKFKNTDISQKNLDKILKASRFAPSGVNSQPWEIIIVSKQDKKKDIAKIIAKSQSKSQEKDNPFPYSKKSKIIDRYSKVPYLLVVCGNKECKKAYPQKSFKEEILTASVYSTIFYMKLAATTLNLGMCWGTVNKFSRKLLSEYFELPDHIKPYEVLQLGVPIENGKNTSRKKIDEFTHYNKFEHKNSEENIQENFDDFDAYKTKK